MGNNGAFGYSHSIQVLERSETRCNPPDFFAASLFEVTWQANMLYAFIREVAVRIFRVETYAILTESYYKG